MVPRTFEDAVLPHLDAAFNYARWLTRDDADAEDVVQDACIRAVRYLPSLRDADARAWLFAIVRNAWYSRLSRRSATAESAAYDPERDDPLDDALDPEKQLMQRDAVTVVRAALERLPLDFREVIVLRELEGMSYKEISAVLGVPIGTVMSRISRGRERLAAALNLSPSMEALK
jgi:RNA polymerase sigma-70 factor (ECF subfamily)